MKRSLPVFILFLLAQIASAETIELSDKSIIEAKIIDRTDNDITVNMYGVKMTYLLSEINNIDADLDETIPMLLKARGYPDDTWPDIERELKDFLAKINFFALKNKVKLAQNNPQELKGIVTGLGGLIKQQGCLDLQNPHPLIRLLVNGLGEEDILAIIDSSFFSNRKKQEEKRETFACSAISQLASIILDLLGLEARVVIAPGHVFNSIPLDSRQVLFADFSNEVFEIVDVNAYYRTEGNYRVLKEDQRLGSKIVREINKQWGKGFMPSTLREILNLDLYFYIYMTNNVSATAVIYSNIGNDYEFKGDFNKALANYTQALKANPYIAGVYCNRGFAFAERGNLTQAIADYNKALEINPNDEDAYNDRGLAYKNKDDFARAILDYDKALEINPNSAQIYVNRGNVYSLRGDLAKGILNYTKAIELEPWRCRGVF